MAADNRGHGGKRKGAGRPKGEPTSVLSVRLPAAELARYEADAAAYGLTMRDYAKWALRNMLMRPAWKKRAATGVVGGKP